jgi:ubiquinone/menaquinone biosynthesis C-methylase UbiE
VEIPAAGDTGILKMDSQYTILSRSDFPSEYPELSFEGLYQQVRKKENRFYTDEEVAQLPEIPAEHPYSKEWKIRKRSAQQLARNLMRKKKTLEILEIGCGNGWLSAKLAAISSASVTGIDVNNEEIAQAKRIFKDLKNLRFEYGNILENILEGQQFDMIIFAASIQYFPSFRKIIQQALSLLRLNGEIHIIDSHFYNRNELEVARQRSKEYFERIGFPEMSSHYFHHCTDELKMFDSKILRKPGNIKKFIFGDNNPFYWVCIQNL